MRRAWRRNTQYYYPDPKVLAEDVSRAALTQQDLVQKKAERSWRILNRLRRRLLKEFVYGSPSPVSSRRSPVEFIFKRGNRGLFGLLYRTAWELARVAGVPGTSNYRSSALDRLDRVSITLERLHRMVRKMHIMRLFPWRRRRSRKMNVSFEW